MEVDLLPWKFVEIHSTGNSMGVKLIPWKLVYRKRNALPWKLVEASVEFESYVTSIEAGGGFHGNRWKIPWK